jgi:hypothetical protein
MSGVLKSIIADILHKKTPKKTVGAASLNFKTLLSVKDHYSTTPVLHYSENPVKGK